MCLNSHLIVVRLRTLCFLRNQSCSFRIQTRVGLWDSLATFLGTLHLDFTSSEKERGGRSAGTLIPLKTKCVSAWCCSVVSCSLPCPSLPFSLPPHDSVPVCHWTPGPSALCSRVLLSQGRLNNCDHLVLVLFNFATSLPGAQLAYL